MSKKKKRHEINIMTITTRELKDKLSKLEKNNQILEGTYGDARFEVTKEKSADVILYAVRVFGPSKDARDTIISQFKTLLLDVNPIEFPAGALPCDALFWKADEIDK